MLTPVSKPERQPRECQQGYSQHFQGVAVVGEQLGLPIAGVGRMHHAFAEAHGDDEVQQQVGSYHEHGDADGFLEAFEKDRAECCQQYECDTDMLASEVLRRQSVLHYMRRGVRRGERDRDQLPCRHEAEEGQHEELAFQNERRSSSIEIDPRPFGLSSATRRYIDKAPKRVRSTISSVATGERTPAASAAMPGM